MAAEVTASSPTASGGGGCGGGGGGGGAPGAAQPQRPNGGNGNGGGEARAPLFDDDAATYDGASSLSKPTTSSPVTSPPYWTHSPTHHHLLGGGGGGGSRNGGYLGPGGLDNNHSTESVAPPGGITLQDNDTGAGDDEPGHLSGRDRNRACWAKSVSVTDHVVVNGSATNIGAFVVWNIRVETLSGSYMNIRKRYSEFDDLREKLMITFPNFEAAVPALPPKSVIAKFRPKFLEKRRSGLQYFLNCILLNPEFSGAPVLKEFLFS
ncbi:hypothetical protein GGTG_08329 [Gaeumannomyces tritici R3-111a-1]|uniref:Endosomal/vacuolar adapter protein YPT35 n=1 Tax=Gaeumannomyces tritici (strain R3-111a-1) TaxID=644352 RepID=J3P493_GAET3|nr:hypothetical protein GGTG_08329 [Gaeumannomyces tritici R3-111a-1]EJT74489.1 hypothetical protein GGTG_08329 [Gaeumannomyces tritici R3-111a-1]